MNWEELHYDLPEEAIAQEPIEPRDASRMMVVFYPEDQIDHAHFRDLPSYLDPGDLLVINETKVTALRLMGRKPTGAFVEALLLEEKGPGVYRALMRPGRRLKVGAVIHFEGDLKAHVVEEQEGGFRLLGFENGVEARQIIQQKAQIPLPPYFRGSLPDPERYQTVYAKTPGSAAAPTAGLHFTPAVFQALQEKGVEVACLSLSISIDTFRPLDTLNPQNQKLHGERYDIPEETAKRIAEARGRIIAVGTTSVRALESAAIGERMVRPGPGETHLFISPGYRFQVVDSMITNFHMPRTTMLAMVSAFMGTQRLKKCYEIALQQGYRFLSFGDCMLILGRRSYAR